MMMMMMVTKEEEMVCWMDHLLRGGPCRHCRLACGQTWSGRTQRHQQLHRCRMGMLSVNSNENKNLSNKKKMESPTRTLMPYLPDWVTFETRWDFKVFLMQRRDGNFVLVSCLFQASNFPVGSHERRAYAERVAIAFMESIGGDEDEDEDEIGRGEGRGGGGE